MFDSDYYPPGSYNDPNAPWNEVDNEDVEAEVFVSYTLSKSTKVTTNKYTAEKWEDWDTDDEGNPIHEGGVDYYFDNNDLKEAYLEEITLEDIIHSCLEYAEDDLAITNPKSAKGLYLKRLIEACKGWNVDELEVVKE